ncbi:MAG: hypothetical protein NTW21_40635 [Verrucomicrobia bacterium]|nr:hypothetical protein [Verrucomicrobiota bacterium]
MPENRQNSVTGIAVLKSAFLLGDPRIYAAGPNISLLVARQEFDVNSFAHGGPWLLGEIYFQLANPRGRSAISGVKTFSEDSASCRIPAVIPVETNPPHENHRHHHLLVRGASLDQTTGSYQLHANQPPSSTGPTPASPSSATVSKCSAPSNATKPWPTSGLRWTEHQQVIKRHAEAPVTTFSLP